jgi:hypothetical protein
MNQVYIQTVEMACYYPVLPFKRTSYPDNGKLSRLGTLCLGKKKPVVEKECRIKQRIALHTFV